jgi:hypothetical protein
MTVGLRSQAIFCFERALCALPKDILGQRITGWVARKKQAK